MSLFTSSSSDMPWLGCRSSRGSGATCTASHVALHELVERHAMAGMSLLARIRSDMHRFTCRSSPARRATCQGWYLATREDPERHARLGTSLRIRVNSDMDRFAVSLERSSKATFTLLHVAPRLHIEHDPLQRAIVFHDLRGWPPSLPPVGRKCHRGRGRAAPCKCRFGFNSTTSCLASRSSQSRNAETAGRDRFSFGNAM